MTLTDGSMDQGPIVSSPRVLDRSRLKLDLQSTTAISAPGNKPSLTGTPGSIAITPLSAPARSPYLLEQVKSNVAISRRSLEAWQRALTAAAPGTTMYFRNRDKSPIESLQRVWDEKKRKDSEPNSEVVTPRRKSVSFLLLRKPASSLRRFYQRAMSTETPSTPWNIVNTAFTAGPLPKTNDQSRPTQFIEQTLTSPRIRTTEL